MGLFSLFTSTPDKPKNVIRVIYEHNGPVRSTRFIIDNDYADMGEGEGWLEYTGYHYEGNDFVMVYTHIS